MADDPLVLVYECPCCEAVTEALVVDAGEPVAVVLVPGPAGGWGCEQHGEYHPGPPEDDPWLCLHIRALMDLLAGQVTS